MGNLFSIFDPASSAGLSLNWISTLMVVSAPFPVLFWISNNQISKTILTGLKFLHLEMTLALGNIKSPGVTHLLLSLLVYILLNNLFGLTPYVFTSSSHLSFTLTLSLTIWLTVIISAILKDLKATLAHLVPLGTPYILMPLMVLIEIVSNMIRPITLSVRLAANMVAGHLLLTLIGSSATLSSSLVLIAAVLVGLILMMILESAVALIQSYVFSTLSSLYVADVNSKFMWK